MVEVGILRPNPNPHLPTLANLNCTTLTVYLPDVGWGSLLVGAGGGGSQGSDGGVATWNKANVQGPPWPADAAYSLSKSHLYTAVSCDTGEIVSATAEAGAGTGGSAAVTAARAKCLAKWDAGVFLELFNRDGGNAGAGDSSLLGGHLGHLGMGLRDIHVGSSSDGSMDGSGHRRLENSLPNAEAILAALASQTQASVAGKPGRGGGDGGPGGAGSSGDYEVAAAGESQVMQFGQVAIYRQAKGVQVQAQPGQAMKGGFGAGGLHGGGGGGSGYNGGGGGGSGIHGAGGGGGSSFVVAEGFTPSTAQSLVPGLLLTFINDTCASLMAYAQKDGGQLGDARKFDIEIASGYCAFLRTTTAFDSATASLLSLCNLQMPLTLRTNVFVLQVLLRRLLLRRHHPLRQLLLQRVVRPREHHPHRPVATVGVQRARGALFRAGAGVVFPATAVPHAREPPGELLGARGGAPLEPRGDRARLHGPGDEQAEPGPGGGDHEPTHQPERHAICRCVHRGVHDICTASLSHHTLLTHSAVIPI